MDTFEKKYNDALERARKIHSEIVNNEIIGFPGQIEGIFPELRESEDERVRKSIVATIEQCPDDFLNPKNRDRMLAYLEKQKEQKPHYCHHEVDETGWTEEYRKAYYDGWNNCNMQHEQLKADQKPTEWSEEDKEMIERLIRHTQKEFDELCNDRYGHQEIISDLKESCRERMNWLENRLKSLPERFNLQPRQDWSEEDSKRYISIGTTLETSEVLSKEDYDANMAWLRELVNARKYSSLNPHWKPSEEQMNYLCAAVDAAIRKHNESVSGYEPARVLKSLYEQLKKLM